MAVAVGLLMDFDNVCIDYSPNVLTTTSTEYITETDSQDMKAAHSSRGK